MVGAAAAVLRRLAPAPWLPPAPPLLRPPSRPSLPDLALLLPCRLRLQGRPADCGGTVGRAAGHQPRLVRHQRRRDACRPIPSVSGGEAGPPLPCFKLAEHYPCWSSQPHGNWTCLRRRRSSKAATRRAAAGRRLGARRQAQPDQGGGGHGAQGGGNAYRLCPQHRCRFARAGPPARRQAGAPPACRLGHCHGPLPWSAAAAGLPDSLPVGSHSWVRRLAHPLLFPRQPRELGIPP